MQTKRLPSFLSTQVKLKTPHKGSLDTTGSGPHRASPSTVPSQHHQPVKSSRLSRRNAVILLACITLVVLFFVGPQFGFSPFELWFNTDIMNPKDANVEAINTEAFALAQTTSQIDEGAFVFIALGSDGYHMKCSAAVESLIRHAGWGGEVYIIYDNESCFNAETIQQESGIKREKLHLIYYTNYTVVPSLRGSDDDGQSGTFFKDIYDSIGVHLVRPPDSQLKWRIKATLFDIITDPRIKLLVSVDCDALFAQEGCASSLIAKGLDWKETGPSNCHRTLLLWIVTINCCLKHRLMIHK